MRLGARVLNALGNPRRLFWFGRRAVTLMLGGELRPVLARGRPRDVTDREYQKWCRRRAAVQQAQAPEQALGFFLTLIDCGDAATSSAVAVRMAQRQSSFPALFARAADGSWTRGHADDGHQPAAAHASFEAALAEVTAADGWLLWITAPCTLDDAFVRELDAAAGQYPDARIMYVDEDRLDASGQRVDPAFKPAWDREQILERNYLGPVVAMRARDVRATLMATRPGSAALWQALIAATWQQQDQAIVHIPRVLVHRWARSPGALRGRAMEAAIGPALDEALARRGATGEIEVIAGSARIRYAPLPAGEIASIVIPTRDRADLLKRCVETLVAHTRSPRFEVVIVDNGSVEPATRDCMAWIASTVPTKIVHDPTAFNFARLCNRGVAAAAGSVVVLLNNDAWMIEDTWLDELASLARRPDTGAVGPLVVYGDGKLQSAGILVGVNRVATSVLSGFDAYGSAAASWCNARRQVSAVLGACLAVERRKYLAVGGMDERYAVSLNEVDFCLRLEAQGFANVFTPYSHVAHFEGATRGFEVLPEDRRRLAAEELQFVTDWRGLVDVADPAHNPNLCRRGNPFEIDADVYAVEARNGWRGGPG